MPLSAEDIERRVRAKRVNERLKLTASTVNALALTIVGAAVLVPLVNGTVSWLAGVWISAAAVLHLVAQIVLGTLRSED